MKMINLNDITETDCKNLVRAAWKNVNGKAPQSRNVVVLELGSEPDTDASGWVRISIWCKVYGKEYDITLFATICCGQVLTSCEEIEEVW